MPSFMTPPSISTSTASQYAAQAVNAATAALNSGFQGVVMSYVAGYKALWLSSNYTPQQFCDSLGVNAGVYMTVMENYYAMSCALYPGVIPSNLAWAPYTYIIDGSGRVVIGA